VSRERTPGSNFENLRFGRSELRAIFCKQWQFS
jgi:hypothetical protein